MGRKEQLVLLAGYAELLIKQKPSSPYGSKLQDLREEQLLGKIMDALSSASKGYFKCLRRAETGSPCLCRRLPNPPLRCEWRVWRPDRTGYEWKIFGETRRYLLPDGTSRAVEVKRGRWVKIEAPIAVKEGNLYLDEEGTPIGEAGLLYDFPKEKKRWMKKID
jgi:hypothetical protein